MFGFADVSVASVRMEATENELPPSVSFRVTSFPTIKFKPAGSRDFLDYWADRSLESLIAFVESHLRTMHESDPEESSQDEDPGWVSRLLYQMGTGLSTFWRSS
jgi:protein disulfide-isomerase A1